MAPRRRGGSRPAGRPCATGVGSRRAARRPATADGCPRRCGGGRNAWTAAAAPSLPTAARGPSPAPALTGGRALGAPSQGVPSAAIASLRRAAAGAARRRHAAGCPSAAAPPTMDQSRAWAAPAAHPAGTRRTIRMPGRWGVGAQARAAARPITQMRGPQGAERSGGGPPPMGRHAGGARPPPLPSAAAAACGMATPGAGRPLGTARRTSCRAGCSAGSRPVSGRAGRCGGRSAGALRLRAAAAAAPARRSAGGTEGTARRRATGTAARRRSRSRRSHSRRRWPATP